MDQFGAYLKTQRESKGIRLEEIASITKIHLHSLEMLEASRWEALPPEPFIRGFIIAYAKYVGLAPKETLERYFDATGKRKIPGESEGPALVPSPSEKRPTAGPIELGFRTLQPIYVAAAVVLVFAAGLMITLISIGKKETHGGDHSPASLDSAHVPPTSGATAPETAAPAPSSVPAPVAPAPVAPPTSENRAPSSTSAPTPVAVNPSGHEITVETKERSWVKVVADDEAPVESFLDPGKRTTFKANSKIKVTLGNAAGATVLYNGQPTEGNRFMGTIRYFKYPPTARFPQDVRVKRATAEENTGDAATTTTTTAPATTEATNQSTPPTSESGTTVEN